MGTNRILNKSLNTEWEIPPQELLAREAPEASKKSATLPGLLTELEGKRLMLKTPHTFDSKISLQIIIFLLFIFVYECLVCMYVCTPEEGFRSHVIDSCELPC